MKNQFVLASATALLLLTGCASTSHTTAWEYRWITPVRTNFQKELDAAAKDGWEVVSATPDASADTMSAVLRRPKK